MNSRDKFIDTRVVTGLANTALSSATVTNGAAVDISNAVGIAAILQCFTFSTGTVGIQDVQFANDSSFSENVTTYTSDDILMKNDRTSATSAIAQMILAATGRRKLSFENRAVNGQKYMRVRVVTTGTVSLSARVDFLINEDKSPVVQA